MHIPAFELSSAEARHSFLAAQGLRGTPDRRAGVRGVLERLGAVQLDTIAVLARSHELVAYARLGPVGRQAVEAAYWGGGAFEYWAHAACIMPVQTWPLFAFRRRHNRTRRADRLAGLSRVVREVVDRLRDEGPLTAAELGGARRGGTWWSWSDVKVACEDLLAIGEVVCMSRRGWRRVYDLAARAVPGDVLGQTLDDAACHAALVAAAGARLGVATRADLADYYRLRVADVEPTAAGLVPVAVEGWRQPAWADPAVLVASGARARHRTTLLSPFDSLIWHRARTERVFGLRHRLEAYVPRAQREHGYFAMPLLAGGRLLGRVDPGRDERTLVARQVSVESRHQRRAAAPMAAALHEAAEWVGCDAVRVDDVEPPSFKAALVKALT